MKRWVWRDTLVASLVVATLAVTLVLGPSAGAAGGGGFTTAVLPGSNGFSEPREAIDNAGNFWIESNAADGSAAIWGSSDGLTWTPTPNEPAGQTLASTDVDIVTTPSG